MQTIALFDLDGVIVDTEGQYTLFWEKVGKRDFPETEDFAARIKGHTLKQIVGEYYPNDVEKRQQVIEELWQFEREMDFPYIKGAVTFVRALREAKIPVAVVTSSDNKKMQCLFKCNPELPELFDRIFTAEDARRSKPAPDCYIDAARALGGDAQNAVVFEDSISGLQAGRNSGALVVGLTTTNSAKVIEPLCDKVINDFTEITVVQMCNLLNNK